MLNKKAFSYCIYLTGVLYISLFITACTSEGDKPDISGINLMISADRFEKDLFSTDISHPEAGMSILYKKYGNFFNLFLFQVTAIGSRDTGFMLDKFKGFISDTNFLKINEDCQKTFGGFADKNADLTKAFRYYSYYFPGKIIPKVVTMISGFSYPVVCDSTTLGISLDMYLGPAYRFYNTLEPPLPIFLRSRMQPEYIVCDAMKGWASSDYSIDETTAKMMDFMISQGRLLYYLEKITPDEPDTIKTGYSAKQLAWCKSNEKLIWSFFIDNKLLFSADPNLMNKYVNDGPTTNGFPKDSPGNIGQFIGWQIVRSFMKNHTDVSLQKLMEEKDMMKIYNESKYKPVK